MFKKIKHTVLSRFVSAHESVLFGALILTVLIGPLFFIPLRGFSLGISKGFFILFIGLIGLFLYSVAVLKKGVIDLPRHPVWIALLAIVGVSLLGSFLAPSFASSLFGYGFETSTWIFVALFALFALFAYRSVRSFERVGILFGGLMISFVGLVVLQLIRFFAGPATANLGVMFTNTATLIGSWGDLGILLGLVTLFAVITLELGGLKKTFKWIVGIIGLFATVLLLFMNIQIIWIILGFIALVASLYLFSFAFWDKESSSYRKDKRVPAFMLGLFTIAIIGIFFGGFFNGVANNYRNISFNDIRPSVKMTVRTTEKSIVKNFATGFGPNMFHAAWTASRPSALSANPLVDGNFDFGFGYIPTQIATGGILGLIAWVSFFVLLLVAIIRSLVKGFENSVDRYFVILLGVSIIYLGIMTWAYIPGTILLILFAILIGSFFGINQLYATPKTSDMSFSFIKDPRASFFGILGITAIIVITIIGVYVGVRKFVSFVQYNHGQNALSVGDVDQAIASFNQAASLAKHDIYHTALTNLAFTQVNQLANSITSTTGNKEVLSAQINEILGTALGHAQATTTLNPADYRNWVLVGDVYRFMVSLGIGDTFDRATEAYQTAVKKSPHDPKLKLYFAQLALANKNTGAALGFIADSIDQYPTADAFTLRGQIENSQGKTDNALVSMRQAVLLNPYNVNLVYTYGVLLFNNKKYTDAIGVFQRAIALNQKFGEAFIYLGVSYERVNDTQNAQKIFTYVRQQIPEADTLINRVRNGTAETPAPEVEDQVSNPPSTTTAPTPKKP